VRPGAVFSSTWQSLSGLLQNFYHLVRVVQRVHRHIGEKLCANHGGREAAQVNSPVGKLLSQLRGDARPVTAHDSNGMEGMHNVKTHLRSCSDFPVTPEWRDEHYSLAGFCTPGDDELQVCARFPQLDQYLRKAARSVFDGGRPHIDMFRIFHERIHNRSPSSQRGQPLLQPNKPLSFAVRYNPHLLPSRPVILNSRKQSQHNDNTDEQTYSVQSYLIEGST